MPADSITFGKLYQLYFELHAKDRTRCPENTRFFYSLHGKKWEDRPVHKITSFEVQEWVDQIGQNNKPSANRAVHMMSAIFNWGIKRGYVTCQNPCVRVEKFRVRARERFLLPQELARFFDAL